MPGVDVSVLQEWSWDQSLGLGRRASEGGGQHHDQHHHLVLGLFPPAFSPVEDSKQLIRFLRGCDARPVVFTPLITRFFNSVSDDEQPWGMLDQLHCFDLALNSNKLYKLELSMVEQIQEEFQSMFLEVWGFEPEYEEIMSNLQTSVENAEMAIEATGPPNASF